MHIFATLILSFILQTTPTPRQITVILVDADDRPVAGQAINLTIHVPLTRQTCHTDERGRCHFTFSADGNLLRGDLVIVGRGRRSITWKGPQLEVPLQLTAGGEIDVPADYVPPAPAEPTLIPLMATAPMSPTVTARPTNTVSSAAIILESNEGSHPAPPAVVPEINTENVPVPADPAQETTAVPTLFWGLLIGGFFSLAVVVLAIIAWLLLQRRSAP